jgi:long-subunit fatty acid transport protein
MRVFFVLLILNPATFGFSQGWAPAGGRSRAMGDASVTLQDVWAYHHNPAALSNLKQFGIGISYENRFLLKELQTQSLSMALPLKKGVLSFGAQSFGYTQFRTLKAGIGYSLKLSDIFSVGVQMNAHQIRIGQGYGNSIKATGEAGMLAEITPKWNVGFAVVNFTRTQISAYQEDRLTTVLRIGSSYRFSDRLLTCIEGEKNIEYGFRGKAGVEYMPMKNFHFRAGFATQPIEINAGVGYAFKGLYFLDFGSAFTQQLGWSPNVSFTYKMK